MANNIRLIEPNNVNINTNIVNGIPQYQDMFIFAELKAQSRGRTVIVTANDGNVSKGAFKTGLEKPRKANLLGVNQNEEDNNPNYLNFTTNYYDGSTGSYTQYESFGITGIKVIINSSFIPQVNIQFVDLRGLSFFNNDSSPYRMLFDFPPPIFDLTIKGYYGKALNYRLHLVKYTSEFQTETGNFLIDAQFVAITYAPLTDILFRYVYNAPLINNLNSMSSESSDLPQNTFELILKLKNLYSAIEDKIKNSDETKEYEDIRKNINNIDQIISIISAYRSDIDLKKTATPYLAMRNKIATPLMYPNNEEQPSALYGYDYEMKYVKSLEDSNNNDSIEQLAGLFQYENQILSLSTSGIPSSMDKKLYIVYPIQVLQPLNNIDPASLKKAQAALVIFRTRLINKSKEILGDALSISNIDVSNPEQFFCDYDIKTQNKIKTAYVGIDLTNLYLKLYKERSRLKDEKADISKNIATNINNMIIDKVGMKLTIYNVFEVICNDIDNFFQQLRVVSKDAEDRHHVIHKDIILGSQYKDTEEKIYAFPLFVDQARVVCGGTKEERIAPIALSQRTEPDPFPEIQFVNAFIQTFFSQRNKGMLYNMRLGENDDGTSKWLPLSPFDSKLGTDDPRSPYYDTIPVGDAVNISSDNMLKQILDIVLKRYYIISQSSISNSFYGDNNKSNNAYIQLYASSEAANLATAVNTSKVISDNVKDFADDYGLKRNISEFYTYLEKNNQTLYNFNDVTYFEIADDAYAYADKLNANYEGVRIYDGMIEKQVLGGTPDKPIDKFKKVASRGWFSKIFAGKLPEEYYDFTMENVMYIFDGTDKKTEENAGVNLYTRFITTPSYFNYPMRSNERENALQNGNNAFSSLGNTDSRKLKTLENIVDLWIDQLSDFDEDIYSEIISAPSKLGALVFLSNFGYTLSCFNKYPNDLNDLLFNIPAALQVPNFLPLYIGAIVDANESGWKTDIINFFSGGTGEKFRNKGRLIFADLHDMDKYLSENDKTTFRDHFLRYYSNGSSSGDYYKYLQDIQNMYEAVNVRGEKYKEILDPNKDGGYYSKVIYPLIQRTGLIIFSQKTFEMKETYEPDYTPLKELKDSTVRRIRDVNELFFKTFLKELGSQIDIKEKEIIKQEEEDTKLKSDEDIITQTYYSFKNINDKWLASPTSFDVKGYPFNTGNKRLIDSFAFVDRAMNPIGDSVINVETLIELVDDPNVSVFTALSQLLSLNGFEFFPLQNFMSYTNEDWENCFKIDTNDKWEQQPAFVCMYIGGTSSYPTNTGNGFSDDGIVDLENYNGGDFATDECTPNPEDDKQVIGNPTFPYREVRAFKVRFGEQNQSMFTGIKIDSKEYPETNESIQILSRLAGDNKNDAPIPKGQNLYNLYENRSYKATVTAMGNAMIQPTHYFQLENVPMFNGAYIILSVEHDISANKMMTTFSGTKILRYPIPRVTQPFAFLGFEGGDSEGADNLSPGELAQRAGAYDPSKIIDSEQQAQFNSMYKFKIDERWQNQ
jgi:hypothetical protein